MAKWCGTLSGRGSWLWNGFVLAFAKTRGRRYTVHENSIKDSHRFLATGTVPSVLWISLNLDTGRSGWPGRRSPFLRRDLLLGLGRGDLCILVRV